MMARRIRIPGLIDILWLSGAEEIAAAADHPDLDRGGKIAGPLFNRLIRANAADALRTPGGPLPSAIARGDAARAAAQADLAARLREAAWDDAAVDAVASWLGGDHARPLGPLCQELIGRLFAPDYRATRETWRAAEVMTAAARSLNPARRLAWALTGAVPAAQAALAAPVAGDPAAVHATGVAVHTLKAGVESLERALASRKGRRLLSARAAIGQALRAPPLVLRHARRHAQIAGEEAAPGTLVLLGLDSAAQKTLDRRVAFMSGTWSACPAEEAVPKLMAEIWRRATGEIGPDLMEEDR